MSGVADSTSWLFDGGGDVGACMRAIDWSSSRVRHPGRWPAVLQENLRILLASPRPMTLWWGADDTTFYNDAALPLIGNKHPEALGAAAPDVWDPHWSALRLDPTLAGPQYSSIQVDRFGESAGYQCRRVAVFDADGVAAGVLCEFSSETDCRSAVARRRLDLLDRMHRGCAKATSWNDVGAMLTDAIERDPAGISFALLYRAEAVGARLVRVCAAGIEPGHPAAQTTVALDDSTVWPITEVMRTRDARCVTRAEAQSLSAIRGLHGARPAAAFLVPLEHGDTDGLLIVGFSAGAVFEPDTAQFLGLLAGQLSAAVAHAIVALNRSTFQALAETAPTAIFIKDVDGRYTFANPLTAVMLGRADIVGCTDEDLLGVEAAAALSDDDARVLCSAAPIQREQWFGDRAFLLIKFPSRGADGTLYGLYGVAVDITERKRTELALRRSEVTYRAIGESIDYGIWLCDASGRNTFASNSFLELTGMSQQQCSDAGWTAALHPEDVDETMRAWQACVASGGFWSREHRIKGADGRYHFVLARGVPVRNDAGDIDGWVGLNIDVQQIKQAEQQLRDADRRSDRFLSMLAHELRNPLVPIRNSLHVMRALGGVAANQRDAFDMIARQVDNLVRLASDMFDLGRLAQRKFPLRLGSIDLHSLIDAVVDVAGPHVEKLHELSVGLPAENVPFVGDGERLTRVIGSLVIDSATYAPPGSRVELRARRIGDAVEIHVTDNDMSALPELRRSAADTVDAYAGGSGFTEGVGVGLAVVKGLVELHGGAVVQQSEPAGGTRMLCVRLPIAGPAAVANSLPRPQAPASNTAPSQLR